MADWAVALSFGALGGLSTSLIEVRGDVRAYARGTDPIQLRRVGGWLLVTAITAAAAAAGSWLLWALYATHGLPDSKGFNFELAGESLIAGLGGVGALLKYMHESESGQIAERNTAEMARNAETLAQLVKEDLDRGGDPAS